MNVGEVGDWANKLIKQKPGWNEVLTRASKMPGANVKLYYLILCHVKE